MISNLPEHLEEYLGEIKRGWSTPKESKYKYSVVEFHNWEETNIRTYSTLGVSNHILAMPQKRSVRQEFLMCSSQLDLADEVSGFLLRFSDMVLSKHKAILSGEVVGPGKPLLRGTEMCGIYATNPAIYPENLHIYDKMSPNVVITWLIPVYASEIDYVNSESSDAFESLLEGLGDSGPDLWDLKRVPLL